MATSGSSDFSINARTLITFALHKTGLLDVLSSASGADAKVAMRVANLMLKGLQNEAPSLWRQTFGNVALVGAQASYSITPVPHRIHEMRYRDAGGRDLPMWELTRQEYVDLPLKTSSGVPTTYYVDYQRASVTVYIWPVPAAVTTQTLQFTYQRRFEDIDALDNDLDIPQEHLETLGYMLASRLAEDHGLDVPKIDARAAILFETLKSVDREPVVRFIPDRR